MWVFNLFFFYLKGDVCVCVCVFSVIPIYWEVLNCPHSIYEILMLSYFNDVSKHQSDYTNMS